MSAIRAIAATVALGMAWTTPSPAQTAFPHRSHDRLFPLCTGCHDVEEAGGSVFPSAAVCDQCHDGDVATPVTWTPPGETDWLPHDFHSDRVGVRLRCGDCHGGDDGVRTVRPSDRCGSCHEPHHSAGVRCRSCHGVSPRDVHGIAVHRGCAGSACHEPALVAGLSFDRELCLLCHQDKPDHRPGRSCALCHAVDQPTTR